MINKFRHFREYFYKNCLANIFVAMNRISHRQQADSRKSIAT